MKFFCKNSSPHPPSSNHRRAFVILLTLTAASLFAFVHPVPAQSDTPEPHRTSTQAAPEAAPPPALVKTQAILGERTELEIELALTPQQRTTGLMFRTELPANAGMLFVFPDAAERAFWMKDTLLPLRLAYINAAGIITSIHTLTPLSTASVPSTHKIVYALETSTALPDDAIQVGDTITLPHCPYQTLVYLGYQRTVTQRVRYLCR